MRGMPDYYKTLGVSKDATQQEIKSAFRNLAKRSHTDKGGDKSQMQMLNEAYETLSDPEKRTAFDREWEAGESMEGNRHADAAGFITSNAEQFSKQFKLKHEKWIQKYRAEPLRTGKASAHLKPYRYGADRSRLSRDPLALPEITQSLTPQAAINILVNFLKNGYPDEKLPSIRRYLAAEASRLHSAAAQKQLYEGIFEMMAVPLPTAGLLSALKKITNFAKSSMDIATKECALLFQNEHFRDLYSLALHQYWQEAPSLNADVIKAFDGREATRDIIINLKEKKSTHGSVGEIGEHLNQLISKGVLLYRYEKDLHQEISEASTAEKYREKAFRIIDWISGFLGVLNQPVIVNTFIQAGIYFQMSSRMDAEPAKQMADERMALEMFLQAIFISHRATPNVELYARIHSLKFIMAFRYQTEKLPQLVKDLQERALVIANMFPFYEPLQTNIQMFTQHGSSVLLMRQLLQALIKIIEANRRGDASIRIDHKATTVLYQAYEASLKNWYQDYYSPSDEEQLRVMLMEELLNENRWSFADIDNNTDALGVLVERDAKGWMVASSRLPIPNDPSIAVFQSIDGIEINHNTGELSFSFKGVREDYPDYTRLITAYDLAEMIERNIAMGIFSLDGVDPDMEFHPFNQMRFAPLSLHKTQMMHSMLITDYLLKFFTVGREVKGKPPYDKRSLDNLISRLPAHLKKIITDFHAAQRSESAHRFWIETGKVMVAQDDPADGIHRLALGEIKMVVKKHLMMRDKRGNLVDAIETNEGWSIYVVTEVQLLGAKLGARLFEGSAMIFIKDTNQVCFYEDGEFSSITIVSDCAVHLAQLFKCQRGPSDKVLTNEDNAWLVYTLSKEVAHQAGKPHRFSAEYSFAQQFTARYNEFAQYFPEFGRLRELSKMALLVNFAHSFRESNRKNIRKFSTLLDNVQRWQILDEADIQSTLRSAEEEHKRIYNQIHAEAQDDIQARISRVLADIASLPAKVAAKLRELQNDIGPMHFDKHSPEIDKIVQENIDENERRICADYGYVAWVENSSRIEKQINAKRGHFASELSKAKYKSIHTQLYEQFVPEFITERYGEAALNSAIFGFLDGNISDLQNAWVEKNIDKLKNDLHEMLSDIGVSMPEIEMAANPRHSASGISKIVIKLTRKKLSIVAEQLQEKITALNTLDSQFSQIGMPEGELEVNLEGVCLWIPANAHHDVEQGHFNFVYGGVSVNPKPQYLQTSSPMSSTLIGHTFTSQSQARIGADYLAAGRAASASQLGDRGSANVIYNLRLQEMVRSKMAEAAERGRDYIRGGTQAAAAARPAAATAMASTAKPPATPPVGYGSINVRPASAQPPVAAAGGAGMRGGGKDMTYSGGVTTGGNGGSGGAAGGGGSRPPSPPDSRPPQGGSASASSGSSGNTNKPVYAGVGKSPYLTASTYGQVASSVRMTYGSGVAAGSHGGSGGAAGGGGSRPPSPPDSRPPQGGSASASSGSSGNTNKPVYGGVGSSPYLAASTYGQVASSVRMAYGSGVATGSHGGSGGAAGSGGSRPPSPTAEVFGPGGAGVGIDRYDRKAVTKGFQDHHIISHTNDLTKNHKLLGLAGFDLESRSNKIFLPANESLHPTRSIHNGRHVKVPMKEVARKMDDIVALGESKGWGQAKYKAELEAMLSEIRQDLKAGNIALNKHKRDWSNAPDK